MTAATPAFSRLQFREAGQPAWPRHRARGPFRFAGIVALLSAGALPAQDRSLPAADWLGNLSCSATVTAAWVENVSRTSFEPTRKDAATYEFEAGAAHHRQLAPNWLLAAAADTGFLTEPEFDRNDRFELGASLGVQRKFGLGPFAPVAQIDAGIRYRGARYSGDSGWTVDGSLRLAKRVNPALRVAIAGRWLEHFAGSAAFDLRQRSIDAEANWDLTERWSLSGTLSRLSGHVVANAAPAIWSQAIGGGLGPTVFNYYNSIAWEVSELYGPGWVSYNVEADVNLWSLALAFRLDDQTTLELRGGGAYVVNKIDIRYPTDSWGLSVVRRF